MQDDILLATFTPTGKLKLINSKIIDPKEFSKYFLQKRGIQANC